MSQEKETQLEKTDEVTSQTRQLSDLPRDVVGRIKWVSYKEDLILMQSLLEEETGNFIEAGYPLTFRSMMENKRSDLSHAIQRYYPKGLYGMQLKFGLASSRKRKPRGFWRTAESAEFLRNEILSFYKQHGELTLDKLHEENRTDLIGALRNYPGRLQELQQELGLTVRIAKYEYWTKDRILTEAREFYEQHKKLTSTLLAGENRSDLLAAIVRKYPGRLFQLKIDLGIDSKQKAKKYWKNPKTIEQEAKEFYLEHGWITQNMMLEKGRSDLWAAIIRYYPGRIRALRENLSITQKITKPEHSTISKEDANRNLEQLLEVKNET